MILLGTQITHSRARDGDFRPLSPDKELEGAWVKH